MASPIRLAISTFAAQPPPFPRGCKGTDDDRADLYNYRRKMLKALAAGSGALSRDALEGVGLSAEDCSQAKAIEWKYKPKVKFAGGENRSEIISRFGEVSTFTPILPKAWELAADLLISDNDFSPNIEIIRGDAMPRREGTGDFLRLKYRREISKSYSDKPTLLLDATGRVELVRQYYPDVEMVAEVSAATPYRHVRQITDRPCAKSMFVYPSDSKTAEKNIKRLTRYLEVEAAKYRGQGADDFDVLIVCQLDVELALNVVVDIPRLDIAHFNDIAGSNKWSGVAKLIILGRTLPSPEVIEQLASVICGKPVSSITGAANNWFKFPVPIHKNDGSTEYVMAPRHPDPIAEAVRWSICEGQLLQTEGRGRAVNRTADNPLDVDILTNIPLPITVDETTTWDEILPSPIEVMAARGIVGLDWPTVAAVLPDVFKNKKAVEDWFRTNTGEKKRLKAIENPENSYKDILIGKFGVYADYRVVEYRIPGNRRKRLALVDLNVHPEPGSSLSQLYGHAVEVISSEANDLPPVTYLDPPFEEAVHVAPPATPQTPKLIVETNQLGKQNSDSVTTNTSPMSGFPEIGAGYHTILDWVTGGGIPEEDDHSEAIDIWLSGGRNRPPENLAMENSYSQAE
jgi:hypothetical protein